MRRKGKGNIYKGGKIIKKVNERKRGEKKKRKEIKVEEEEEDGEKTFFFPREMAKQKFYNYLVLV